MREDIFGRVYDRVGRGLPLLGTPNELAERLLEGEVAVRAGIQGPGATGAPGR